MKQCTADSIGEVLNWIDTNEHHMASLEDPRHFIMQGHQARLRIPYKLHSEILTQDLIHPNPREFDSRMYAPNSKGRRYLNRWRKEQACDAT